MLTQARVLAPQLMLQHIGGFKHVLGHDLDLMLLRFDTLCLLGQFVAMVHRGPLRVR